MSLEKSNAQIIFHTNYLKRSPTPRTYKKFYVQGTSLCAYQKGSLTVEVAVVVPLAIGFLCSILFFFRIMQIQITIDEALVYTGRRLAVESCLTDSEEVLYVSAEALFKYRLCQDERIERYVTGQALGVTLFGSKLSGADIELEANCLVKFPIELFGKQGIWLTSKNCFKKWCGDQEIPMQDGEWVYITETGTVYHKDTTCRSLDLHIREGRLSAIAWVRGKNGQRYKPCRNCMDENPESEIIYYTDYGDLYHGQLSCKAIKRTIYRILISEVGDKRPCSFCYE